MSVGLQLAEFGGTFAKEPVGLGAGAIDYELSFRQVVRAGGGEAFFDEATAAQTPGGVADFVDEGVFEDADRGKFIAERIIEFRIERMFAGTDEIVEVLGWC